MKQHQGKLLEKIIESKNVKITDLAEKLSINRRSIYHWFKKAELKDSVISAVAKAIEVDILKEYADAFPKEQEKEPKLTYEEKKQSKQKLLDKYLGLQERHILLQEKYAKLLEQYSDLKNSINSN